MRNPDRNKKYTNLVLIIISSLLVVLLITGFFGGNIGRTINKGIGILTRNESTSVNQKMAKTTADEQKTITVAGVIRNTGDGWQLIEDDKHAPLNCKGISVNKAKGSISIDYSDMNIKKVISFTVTPDETLSSLGYTCGASVGTNHADVYIYHSNAGLVLEKNPEKLISSSGNLWFSGIFEIE